MLNSLRVQNFKSWADTGDLRLAPITGLFGSNSSGKTSILQLLLLLKQTVESTDRAQVLDMGDDRSLVNLGTFREIVHGHPALESTGEGSEPSVEWSLEWTLPEKLVVDDPSNPGEEVFSTDAVYFDARIMETGRQGNALTRVDRFAYTPLLDSDDSRYPVFGMRRRAAPERYELVANDFELKRPPGRPPHFPAPVKCYGFPDQVFGYYQNVGFLAQLQLAFERLFTGMYYLGPLRDYPRRQYTWGGSRPSDMGRRGERVIDALLASRDPISRMRRPGRRTRATVEEVVAGALKGLGLVESFEVKPIASGSSLYQVLVQRAPGIPPVLITDVGFGVSQILPVLTLCYYVPEGSTIILEPPEIHLHPAVQAGLADVLIDAVKTRRVQIILESHSEHLLTRLQRRIAEEALQSSQSALYFCDMEPSGSSRITPLEMDQYGNIVNWPQGFFGDELGERAAMAKAALRRRAGGTQA
jgi:hypothetical protein